MKEIALLFLASLLPKKCKWLHNSFHASYPHAFLISFCAKLKVSGKKHGVTEEQRRGNYQEFDAGSFGTFFL